MSCPTARRFLTFLLKEICQSFIFFKENALYPTCLEEEANYKPFEINGKIHSLLSPNKLLYSKDKNFQTYLTFSLSSKEAENISVPEI